MNWILEVIEERTEEKDRKEREERLKLGNWEKKNIYIGEESK